MYDNLKQAVTWIFIIGLCEFLVGMAHAVVFGGEYLPATIELAIGATMVYWSLMMMWVLIDTEDE